MLALIDGDIITYRCAASAEEEPLDVALMRCDSMMMDIMNVADTQLSFLTGSQTKYPAVEQPNFRNIINPEYKKNRSAIIPVHLNECRKYLIDEYKAIVTEGYEADDALGFNQTEESVIFSIDKDLLMIPGAHYNFVKKEYTEVSEMDGIKTFYKQMLIGDTVDNIFGVKGLGKVKAAKLIDPLDTEKDMFDLVYDLYGPDDREPTHLLDELDTRFWMNANCLWIWRKEGETFSKRYENLKTNSS